jgi:hypothetical protein
MDLPLVWRLVHQPGRVFHPGSPEYANCQRAYCTTKVVVPALEIAFWLPRPPHRCRSGPFLGRVCTGRCHRSVVAVPVTTVPFDLVTVKLTAAAATGEPPDHRGGHGDDLGASVARLIR